MIGEIMAERSILIVDDEQLIRWSLDKQLSKEGYRVLTVEDGESALSLIQLDTPDLILLDLMLPGIDGLQCLRRIKHTNPNIVVIILSANEAVEWAIEAMKLGAHDYIVKPYNPEELSLLIKSAFETADLRSEVSRMRKAEVQKYCSDNIIGQSSQIKEVLQLIGKISQSDTTTVLIQGESGTGKDLVGRAIHYSSARRNRPFMEINCTAVPETLLESELFGHERGAFTGAREGRKGLFELADGGSVLLDEIGDMKSSLQSKLLKVIEQKIFKRIGGSVDINVDVRIIASSNRNLKKAVDEGRFRQDLFYRLNVVPVFLSPLREHIEDIPILVEYFVKHFNKEFRRNIKGISPEALDLLISYQWPGNVRELRNMIERIIILESDDIILPHYLPAEIRQKTIEKKPSFHLDIPKEGISLKEVEKQLILEALERCAGNQSQAARLLSISRDSLRYHLKKFGVIT